MVVFRRGRSETLIEVSRMYMAKSSACNEMSYKE
jgi:hypothetical protein